VVQGLLPYDKIIDQELKRVEVRAHRGPYNTFGNLRIKKIVLQVNPLTLSVYISW
jgi:hypothetical protein